MTEITDEQVLAELREDEGWMFRQSRLGLACYACQPSGSSSRALADTMRRLALSRIEAREAAAREREAITDEIAAEIAVSDDARVLDVLRDLGDRIRARGGAA